MTFLTSLRKFLVRVNHVEDFGHELYINLLNLNTADGEGTPVRWSAIPISMRWDMFPGRPELSFSIGGYSIIATSFRLYKFALSFSLIPLFLTYCPNDLDF
jgi:hypothetical protein